MIKLDELSRNIGQPTTIGAPPTETQRHDVSRPTMSQLDTSHHAYIARMVQRMREWNAIRRDDRGASVVLAGSVGIGKSHVARAAMWCEAYVDDSGALVAPCGKFFVAGDIIDALGDEGVRDIVPLSTPVIAIDDVGTETRLRYVATATLADEVAARYFKLIDYCVNNKVGMIITTNLSLDALRDRVGVRAWSRLMMVCQKGYIMDFGNAVPDYRQKIRNGGRL